MKIHDYHVIRDLGDTINTPPSSGQDLIPFDQCEEIRLRNGVRESQVHQLNEPGFVALESSLWRASLLKSGMCLRMNIGDRFKR